MDENQGASQGTDAKVSAPVTSPAPAHESHGASDERTFKQSEVSNLVSREKAAAVEAYRRQQQEQPHYVAQKYGPQNNGQPDQATHSDDRIRQVAAEEAKRHFENVRQEAFQKSQDEMAQRTVQNFRTKVQTGREKYTDFDKVAPNEEILSSYPNVVQLLGDFVDNSGDILYHLGQDMTKLELIESMATRTPQAAIRHMQQLSQSIKDNEAAGKIKLPRQPLDQMRPSNTGTDGGVMSVRDYRNKYKA
jgi:hypothetical protein